jgi:hypothetical protein
MKNRSWKKALIFSAVATGILTAVGWITALTLGEPWPHVAVPGGECIDVVGVGVSVMTVYPMTNDPQMTVSTHRSFRPDTLLLTFLVLFLVSWLVFAHAGRKKTA